MSTINRLNIIQVLRERLEVEVKALIEKEIVREELIRFEDRIRLRLEPVINKVSFSYIDSVKEYENLREEISVYVEIKGSDGA